MQIIPFSLNIFAKFSDNRHKKLRVVMVLLLNQKEYAKKDYEYC